MINAVITHMFGKIIMYTVHREFSNFYLLYFFNITC